MSKTKKPKDRCPNCGSTAPQTYPDGAPMQCPRCARFGCDECLPGGRGAICPECEEASEDEGMDE